MTTRELASFEFMQAVQVSSLMMPAPSSPQKYWDELSQPPSPKGEDLLIQNIVTAIEICGMLVISSPKTLQNFFIFQVAHIQQLLQLSLATQYKN